MICQGGYIEELRQELNVLLLLIRHFKLISRCAYLIEKECFNRCLSMALVIALLAIFILIDEHERS